MTPKERIARLEVLLERVQGRKLDAREIARELDAPSAELDALLASQTEVEELDSQDMMLDEPDIDPGWSIPAARPDVVQAVTDALPGDLPSEPLLLVGDDATNLDDYEVAEVVELDGDGDDDAIRRSKAPSSPPEEELLESRQRLVSAVPADFEEEDDEPRSIPLVQRRPSQIPPDFGGDLPVLEAGGDAPGDEPAPSSRRPIATQLAELDDFEADLAPPRPLTQPPESGKQVAAQESAAHGFEEDFSSSRDETRAEEFVGGAMPMLEAPPMDDLAIALDPVPAVAVAEQDAMEMVLPAAQSPGEFVRPFDGQLAPAEAASPPASQTRPGLAPEIVNADLASTSHVAAREGAPPSFSPATFGELLDTALSL